MKSIIVGIIFILATLIACETENPDREESSILAGEDTSIIVGEGSTIVVGEGVSVEQQPNQPLSVNHIFQDIVHKRHCGVGDTIVVQATVLDGDSALRTGLIYLETVNDDVRFEVHVDALFAVLQCDDFFKDGEIYELKLSVDSIGLRPEWEIERERNWLELDKNAHLPTLEVKASLILTEKLEKEIREAGCWFDWRE